MSRQTGGVAAPLSVLVNGLSKSKAVYWVRVTLSEANQKRRMIEQTGAESAVGIKAGRTVRREARGRSSVGSKCRKGCVVRREAI